MPGGRRSVWSERRRERGEVIAALAGDRQRGGQADGRAASLALEGERDWLLARVGKAPDLTLRALAAEPAASLSPYAVWHLLIREGITFKKKPARQRAGTSRCGAAAGAMEEVSEQA